MGRLEKMEGLQRITMRQKGDYETDGRGLQNRDQASDAKCVRHGYNEATGKTETVKRDEDAT